MARELRRRTPEELLREVQAEEAAVAKGHLKIFLGYASGVGKSFRMFDEARRRRERGEDVVVGAVQPEKSPDVQAVLDKLEVMPLEMGALLRRHPGVCVIDGLAYDNPAGSRNPTRWRDVEELLNAGISVITSVNIQYVADLRDQVEAITGKHVSETVPMEFIKGAAEIVIVDAALEEPMASDPRLLKLREIALVLAADVVDYQLTEYLQCHGLAQSFSAHERVLVCITPRANIQDMIETASVIAEKFHAELIVAYVKQVQISEADQAALDAKLAIARAAGARIEILEGEDPVDTILDFARSRSITQLFIGHSQRSGWWARMWGSPVDKLIRRSGGMDVRVFPQ